MTIFQDSAKPPRRQSYTFALSDRFGDGPPRKPPRVHPRFGGAAPHHVANGFPYQQEELTRCGTAPTATERWDFSKPMGSKNRRPNEHNWKIYGLGPAHYSPGKLAPICAKGLAPNATNALIGSGPPRMHPPDANFASADLMYNPKFAGKREPAYKLSKEKRLEHRTYPSLASDLSAAELIREAKRGAKRLSDDQRREIVADRRAEHDDGCVTYEKYNARSDFSSSAQAASSGSFSFSRSVGSDRFHPPPGELSAQEKVAQRREMSASSKSPAMRAQLGVAYRANPKHMPGPGDYAEDEGRGVSGGGFDGTGKLVLSKSSPAFSLVSRVPMGKLTGKPFEIPDSGTYFPSAPFTRPGSGNVAAS